MGHCVYFIRALETKELIDGEEYYLFKMGYTSQSLKSRLTNLQVGNPSELDIYKWIYKPYNIKPVEEQLHREFRDCKIRGEWFRLSVNQINHIMDRYYNFQRYYTKAKVACPLRFLYNGRLVYEIKAVYRKEDDGRFFLLSTKNVMMPLDWLKAEFPVYAQSFRFKNLEADLAELYPHPCN